MTIFDEYKTYTGEVSISPSYFGNMIYPVLTGGNQERLWFSVSSKEGG